MVNLFLEYPKCSTCRKAKQWLLEHEITFLDRHIIDDNPTVAELKLWHGKSGLPLKRFFNTNGLVYKELGLKDKLANMSEEEQFSLLASNGRLIKRPLMISENFVLVGFREEEWEQLKNK